MTVRLALCRKIKSNSKVVYHSLPEYAKVDVSSLTMTCTFFTSLFPVDVEPSEHDGETRFVQINHIAKLSTTDPLNLQRLICSALLWLAHSSGAYILGVIWPSEHDGKSCVVQKNQIPKLSTTHPLNLQRVICPASVWLVHHSGTCFLGVIKPSEHDGKTCLVQKNQIPELSATHHLNMQRSIARASL